MVAFVKANYWNKNLFCIVKCLPHAIGLWDKLAPTEEGRERDDDAPDPGEHDQAVHHHPGVQPTLQLKKVILL